MSNMPIPALDDAQKTRRDQLIESVHGQLSETVARQIKDFDSIRAMGEALLELREQNLWCENADTWGEFCLKEFGFSREYASSMIRAHVAKEDIRLQFAFAVQTDTDLAQLAILKEAITNDNLPLPENERVMRSLLRVPEPLRLKVWIAAIQASKQKIAGQKNIKVPARLVDEAARAALGDQVKEVIETTIKRGAEIIEDERQNRMLAEAKRLFALMDSQRKMSLRDYVINNME